MPIGIRSSAGHAPGPSMTSYAEQKLGQILLHAGFASRDVLREAWEQKVLFGDRLGTNLLATGAVTEEQLARALGEQKGVPAAFGSVIDVKTPAIRRVPKRIAVERMVVPHHFDAGVLYLLMRDVDDTATIREVAALTSLEVVPVICCEARIWSLLAIHYGENPSLRPVPLEDVEVLLARRQSTVVVDAAPKEALVGPELMAEAEFEALYMRRSTPMGMMAAVDVAASPSRSTLATPADSFADITTPSLRASSSVPPRATRSSIEEDVDVPVIEGVPSTTRAPGQNGWLMRTTRGLLESIPPESVDPLPEVSGVRRALAQQLMMTPLSFEAASRELEGVVDRDEIATVVLRAALSTFKRTALLTVFPTMVSGWKARGEGWDDEMIRRFKLLRAEKSVFSLVAESRAHYLGPLQRFSAHGDFVKATGRKLPTTVALFPVLVRGRVVNLLYGDNGHGHHVNPDVAGLLILQQRIATSFESLLSQGQSSGQSPGQTESAPPKGTR